MSLKILDKQVQVIKIFSKSIENVNKNKKVNTEISQRTIIANKENSILVGKKIREDNSRIVGPKNKIKDII